LNGARLHPIQSILQRFSQQRSSAFAGVTVSYSFRSHTLWMM